MKAPTQAVLLRIYTDQDALIGDRSLVETVVQRARDAELPGATVLRGHMGFGESSRLHAHHLFDLGDNLPVVVEIVGDEFRLRAFAKALDDFKDIGLITLERVDVLRYGGEPQSQTR